MTTNLPTLPSRLTDAELADLPLDAGLDALLAELLDAAPADRPRWPLVVAAAASVAVVAGVPAYVATRERVALEPAPQAPTATVATAPTATPSPTTADQTDEPSPSLTKQPLQKNPAPPLGILYLPPGDRAAPVDLAGETLDGARLDLADLRGGTVVLTFWGSWCAPCRDDLVLLADLAPTLDADLVGVNVGDRPTPARDLAADLELPFPSIVLGETWFGSLPGLEDTPRALPVTAVLDSEGRVAAVVHGKIPGVDVIRALVDDPDLPTLPDLLATVG